MTDEEIGREVKRLMKDARLLHAKVWAGIIMKDSGDQFGDDSVSIYSLNSGATTMR
jgi:hypothetical protein